MIYVMWHIFRRKSKTFSHILLSFLNEFSSFSMYYFSYEKPHFCTEIGKEGHQVPTRSIKISFSDQYLFDQKIQKGLLHHFFKCQSFSAINVLTVSSFCGFSIM
ncbi:hypothetical protein CHS0354_031383 [Potamilus streckersoni]|uniref:Uncharacterized protein n=1 Tax=Potamilus streckersoni TaxID=2493646 RepID=A0AAE0VX83_9BIVA|nr:hypothetical protein CHS0354_031383 [Potamilus streckersoni]